MELLPNDLNQQCRTIDDSYFCQRELAVDVDNLPLGLEGVQDGWYLHTGHEEMLGLGIAKQWRLPSLSSSARSMDLERQRLLQQGLLPHSLIAGGWAFDASRTPDHLWESFGSSQWILPTLLIRKTMRNTRVILTTVAQNDRSIHDATQSSTKLLQFLTRHPIRSAENPRLISSSSSPSSEEWIRRVEQAIATIHAGNINKLVLARRVDARFTKKPGIADILKLLRLHNPSTTVFAFKSHGHTFLGATPERLLQLRGDQLQTMALAGTTSRGHSRDEDHNQILSLLASPKDRREHATVVDQITRILRAYANLTVPTTPKVLSLSNVHHLWTPIEGTLQTPVSLLSLSALLHPTPAVGGEPKEEALEWLKNHEGINRGWYAGGIGFMDLAGNGNIWVSLRSALLRGSTAHCYVGCGIMPDSVPVQELAESEWKLQAMLRALGVNQ